MTLLRCCFLLETKGYLVICVILFSNSKNSRRKSLFINLYILFFSPETLTEAEIESKFNTLAINFKTDKCTLNQRVELHRNQRDLAEDDTKNEIDSLKSNVLLLNQLITASEGELLNKNLRSKCIDALNKIESHVNVIHQASLRIASRSESFGAVRQEERLSNAFDVILIHAENLKKSREKEKKELEETKKLVSANGNYPKRFQEGESDSDNELHRRSGRSISTSAMLPKMVSHFNDHSLKLTF